MKLRIYEEVLELVRSLRPVPRRIASQDPDLGRQLRRALASVPLNTAEGYYSRGRNRQARYHNALGSAGESLACLQVAEALEYIEPVDAELWDRFDKVLATLTKLARGR
jgi:four helix bundle protein